MAGEDTGEDTVTRIEWQTQARIHREREEESHRRWVEHLKRPRLLPVRPTTFFHPASILFLDADARILMRYAQRAHVHRALMFLPSDARHTEAERQELRGWLEARLAAFADDGESLEAVEQRMWGNAR